MKKIWLYLRFVRFPMFIVPALVLVVGIIQSRSGPPEGWHDWLAILSIVFISAATFAYNGYEDREIDARKGEPFAKNNQKKALTIVIILYALGLILATALGSFLFLLYFLTAVATIFYSRFIVSIIFLKNLTAALLSALLIILGGAVAGSITRSNIIASLVIFLAISAQEIMNDVEDIEVDKGFRKTLPMVLPMRHIHWIVWPLIILAGLIELSLKNHSPYFYIFYTLAVLSFIIAVVILPKELKPKVNHNPRRFIYAGLWFGLVAFGIAALS